MGVLQHVTISGTIFNGYAYLTQELCYRNEAGVNGAPVFPFSLPKGSYLSSLRAVSDSGIMVRAHVVTPADARRAYEEAGRCSVSLERTGQTKYQLSISNLEAEETARLYISFYVILDNYHNMTILYFPGLGVSTCVDVEIPGDGVLDAKSPSHRVEKTGTPNNLKVRVIGDGADIALQVQYHDSRKNHGYVLREPFGDKIAYYRLYPKLENYEPVLNREVLFLVDFTASMRGGRLAAAKDVLMAILKSLETGKKFNILAVGSSVRAFAPIPVPVDDAVIDRVRGWLMEAGAENGSLLNGFFELVERVSPDVMPILVTSGETNYQPEILKFAQRNLNGSGLGIISVGKNRRAEFLDLLAESTMGYILHIFPSSNIASDTQELLLRLNQKHMEKLSVDPLEGRVSELICPQREPAESGLDVLVRNAGEMPRAFRIYSGRGYSEVIIVDELEVYEGFEMIYLIYGESKLEALRQLLGTASPASWRKIKKQMADIGMQYGILSEEAALVAEISGTRTTITPVQYIIRPDEEEGDGFEERPSMFKEKRGGAVAAGSWDSVLQNIRCDGAIASPYLCDPRKRARQTADAVMTLLPRWRQDLSLRPVFEDAKEYLRQFVAVDRQDGKIEKAIAALEQAGI